MEIIQFFGRLHPLILHLPIGILTIAFLMEWMSRKEKYKSLSDAVGFSIFVGMGSAIFASISGYLLSWEGGYNEVILDRHQYLGITTAIVSVIVFLLHKKKRSKFGKKFYFPIFGTLMALMGITGHYGGSLTHGSDFLTEPFSEENNSTVKVITDLDSALVFQDFIQPILKNKCVSCHNESKIKGDLLMTTIEGLKKGGKSGAFFTSGNIQNSLFLQRAYLPLDDKKHMPPKGKKQLTKNEIALLEWWVEEGVTFNKKIAAVNQSEEIKSILKGYIQVDKSVLALEVSPISENTLIELQQNNIPFELVQEEKNFITVSLRGNKNIDKNTFKALKKVADQLVELDLSDTNLNDDLMSNLSEFPHLQKLFLQKTSITGKNLCALQNLEYLQYLNLYGTRLDDSSIESIAKLPTLQKLFLWQTDISQKAMKKLENTRPKLAINAGINNDIFGSAQLKPAMIVAEKDFFKDTISVKLEANYKGVEIFYTLDNSIPDSTSSKYATPILLSQTANIQTIAYKEGWQNSEISQRTFVRAKHLPTNIQLNIPPNDKYKAEGAKSLINYKKGTTDFAAGEWLGYQGKNVSITLDLGKKEKISSLAVSALESTGSYIFYPKGIEIATSMDGKKFTPIAQKEIPTTAEPLPAETKNFVVEFPQQNAQFIKAIIKSNLKNPSWHPAPGAPCWIFIDEILVD